MKRKDELRLHSDHLKSNPRRVLGVNDGKLIHCSKHEQFYPATENCPCFSQWINLPSFTPSTRRGLALSWSEFRRTSSLGIAGPPPAVWAVAIERLGALRQVHQEPAAEPLIRHKPVCVSMPRSA